MLHMVAGAVLNNDTLIRSTFFGFCHFLMVNEDSEESKKLISLSNTRKTLFLIF